MTELDPDGKGPKRKGKKDKKGALIYKSRFVNRNPEHSSGSKNDYTHITEADV